MFKIPTSWIVVAGIVALVGVLLWSNWQKPFFASPTVSSGVPAASVAEAATLRMASNSELGAYLAAENGMTLYRYANDTPGVSTCVAQCAVNWPPYTVPDAASLKGGTTSVTGAIGTITRADGSLQVTYNNVPLYFWHNDVKVGDTSGQNVGGVWFVVKP